MNGKLCNKSKGMTQTQTENGLDKTEKLGRIKLKCIKKTKSSMQIN